MADTREVQVTDEDVLRFLKQHGAVGGLVTRFIELAAGAAVYERIRATPPSPSTAPEVDVRHEFERYMSNLGEATNYAGDGMYQSPRMNSRADDFRAGFEAARAALAFRPAEVDDEGLPPLPEPFENWDPRYEGLILPVFTAGQYRQGQRDAVAADRARRESLLRECKRFLENMHAMPVEWTVKESQALHQKLSAPSHTTIKEK